MQSRDVIRLTNKTARAIRRSATRMRRLYVAAAVLVTVALSVLAVLLGLERLYAVPLTVIVIVLLDAGILLAGQSRYAALSGQAICTEAAARQIRSEEGERSRRRQAALDFAAIKADVQQSMAQEAESEEDDPDLHPARPEKRPRVVRDMPQTMAAGAQETAHRRRRQAGFQVIESERAK